MRVLTLLLKTWLMKLIVFYKILELLISEIIAARNAEGLAQSHSPQQLWKAELRSAFLHALAAYVSSSLSVESLIGDMLGEPIDHSAELSPELAVLSQCQ